MTQTPPAGWYDDPHDPTQLRWWDGAAWTEHRHPRQGAPTTTQQLTRAGEQLADATAKGLTALGTWVNQNTSLGQTQQQTQPGHPTFASVAASCRDEPPRDPLSTSAEVVTAAEDLAGVTAVYAAAQVPVTPDGARLDRELCRLVPNPWDPADPRGVAVFIGPHMVGRLPDGLEAAYVGPLAQLTTQRLLVTGTAQLWAQGPGQATSARISVRLPDVRTLGGGSTQPS